jgi:hypothetical protein
MYCIEDPSFEGSREQILIDNMVNFIDSKDKDEYMNCVSQFNQITPFNKVKTSILVRIKELYMPDDYS